MGIYDYDKHAKPKMTQEERDEMMKKFLDKGGKVQKLKPGSAAVLGSLDKSKNHNGLLKILKKVSLAPHLNQITKVINLIHTTIMI